MIRDLLRPVWRTVQPDMGLVRAVGKESQM